MEGRLWQEAIDFWNDAREQVNQGNCNFQNCNFPEDPSLIGFNGIVFKNNAIFKEATFEGVAYFNKAVFEQESNFNLTKFNKEAHFRYVIFKGDANFAGSYFTRMVNFVEVTFSSKASFHGANMMTDCFFYDSKFGNVADFDTARFGMAYFHRVLFGGCVWMRRARFTKEANFTGATFIRWSTFEDCSFEDRAEFNSARAVEGIDLTLPTSKMVEEWDEITTISRKRKYNFPFRKASQGEAAYRFAKTSAKNIGDAKKASEYHYAEKCAAETGRRYCWHDIAFSHLSWSGRIKIILVGWLEYFILRLIFGYGEKPIRVVISSFFIILFFSLYFWQMAGITGNVGQEVMELSFIDAFDLSVSSFTTLGYYGDYHPMGFAKFIVGIEAFIGTFFMATFAVVLGRRYLE